MRLKLSNVWENFEEFMERLRALNDPTLTWWFTDRLRTLQSETFLPSNWVDLIRTILLNFKNDQKFRKIFNGYSAVERSAIANALNVPLDPKEPQRGIGPNFKKFQEKLLIDLDGQDYLGTVFGVDYSAKTRLPSRTRALNEGDTMQLEKSGKSQITANQNRQGNDQYGICSVCHSELVNQKQAKIGLCDECV